MLEAMEEALVDVGAIVAAKSEVAPRRRATPRERGVRATGIGRWTTVPEWR